MSSRLDRLFLLLENGSTPLIKKSAALQLGEVQKLYPNELNDLLFRIFKYLQHNEWDTRIAASQAVAAIIKNIPKQNYPATSISIDSKILIESQIKLSEFDIGKILEKNIYLLSSQGSEYDSEDYLDLPEQSIIEKQKLIMKNKLSFHPVVDAEFENNFVNDEDFGQQKNCSNYTNVETLKEYIFSNFLCSINLSSIATLNNLSSNKDNDSNDEPSCKVRKIDPEINEEYTDNQEWPLTYFCNALAVNLFDANWHKRHGAAIGLREIIKLFGSEAAKSSCMDPEEMQVANQIWLQDLCIELLCVLTLDRFADFVSDEMIAPVRESCGQVFGCVVRNMNDEALPFVVRIIKQMLQQPQWQVRHGALIALKYLIAVKKDNVEPVLSIVLSEIMIAIGDSADDVRSIAAASLIPASNYLVTIQETQVSNLIDVLWDSLRSTDELTASSNNVMLLLAQLLSSPLVHYHSDELNQLISLLWPFIDHNIMSVRKAVIITFQSLILMHQTKIEKLYTWLLPILADLMSKLFHRCLAETNYGIIEEISKTWNTILSSVELEKLITLLAPCFPTWIYALINSNQEEYFKTLNRKNDSNIVAYDAEDTGSTISNKVIACKFLGALCKSVSLYDEQVSSVEMEHTTSMCHMMDAHMATKSAMHRLTVANVVHEWTAQTVATNRCLIPDFLHKRFIECLSDMLYFDEVAPKFTLLLADCRKFVSLLITLKVTVDPTFLNSNAWTLNQIENLISNEYDSNMRDKIIVSQQTDDMVASIRISLKDTNDFLQLLTNRVQCAISSCLITLNLLPEKLNPIIRPLMDSVQLEENQYLQKQSAFNISQIIFLCKNREPCPMEKILKKIIQFLYSDYTMTPIINENKIEENIVTSEGNDIIALYNEQMTKNFINQSKNITINNFEAKPAKIQQIGSNEVIRNVVLLAGGEINNILPYLWNYVFKPFEDLKLLEIKEELTWSLPKSQDVINRFQVFQSLLPNLHSQMQNQVLEILPLFCHFLDNCVSEIRHMAARCLCCIAGLQLGQTMELIISLLPWLKKMDHNFKRLGLIELFYLLVEYLDLKIIPYLSLLIVPILGSMTDNLETIRHLASRIFASLVKLMPLERLNKSDVKMSDWMVAEKIKNLKFLEQLLDSKSIESLIIPVPINMHLRKYQQDGVDWLAFLRQYNLHGILCDDMGLGKTLQTICILLSEYHNQNQQEKLNPSLVICPTTLTSHWFYEVEKTVQLEVLKPLLYFGSVTERLRIQKSFDYHNLMIASYDAVRNDIDFFKKINWNYCILDEGHIIKNSKTKLFKAIKMLSTSHRLILSGTPIQNNVLELWSLFDFLMPGFLGTERQFQTMYGKPILASRSNPKQQEAGTMALEALHRQVLPFILRRMKEDVLKDLPPKIIQDYICNLTPLQIKLYEDFSNMFACPDLNDFENELNKNKKSVHIFQAIQYLRKVCNHPSLVLNESHPQLSNILKELQISSSQLTNASHSAKLIALKQLLMDSGIGIMNVDNNCTDGVVNQHRVLLFSQMKNMLNIIEEELFKKEMPSVTYLRIDGGVTAKERFKIVTRFNNDPSIDVLLLTTQVGGLGLNLTGADIVIFFDHDWNPTKDLQAMDRAHRIGQKRVVTVYRIITRGTLEEKIMNLQKFKMNISNSVINEENLSLKTMGTDQLLDLFSLHKQVQRDKDEHKANGKADKSNAGMKSILENLGELWDTQQYDAEYDLDAFMNEFCTS